MSTKILLGCLLQLALVQTTVADPTKIEPRATPPTLRPLEPAAYVAPQSLSSVGTTRPENVSLMPGVYACAPFAMIVVAPAPMDQDFIIQPHGASTMRLVRPPLTLIPLEH